MKYQKCEYGKGNNKHINFPRLKHRRLEAQPCSTNICAHQVSTTKYHVLNGLFLFISKLKLTRILEYSKNVRNKVNNSVGYYSLLCDWRFKIKQIHCATKTHGSFMSSFISGSMGSWGPNSYILRDQKNNFRFHKSKRGFFSGY